jgi:hypothetical protein
MKSKPKVLKTSEPWEKRYAAINANMAKADKAPTETIPRNALSEFRRDERMTLCSGVAACTYKVSQPYLYPKERKGERKVNR